MHPIKYCWALRALFYKFFFHKIGFKSYIGAPLFIAGARRISIGSRTRIFPGMRIEAIGNGSISIGNNTVIEQNAHIISMDQELRIGDDVTIAPNVFITNVNHAYEDIHKSVMDQGYIIRKTSIGNGCFIDTILRPCSYESGWLFHSFVFDAFDPRHHIICDRNNLNCKRIDFLL